MKFVPLLIIFFVSFAKIGSGDEAPVNKDPVPSPYGIKEEWRMCSADSDCIAAVRGCWVWEPINKKYIKDFLRRGDFEPCLSSIDPGLQPVTVCMDKVCKATDKTTNVKFYEWLRESKIGS
jgi:hypothetical protein